MIDEPKYYQVLRSNSDTCAFILCYADRFYADVPYHVRKKGPWTEQSRSKVVKLKAKLRRQLTTEKFVVLRSKCAVLDTSMNRGR